MSQPGVIAVHVRRVSQLFDSLDPSPFHEKELDPQAHEYIVATAKELPAKAALRLVVHADEPPVEPEPQRVLLEAIHNHFGREAQAAKWSFRRLMRRGWISLAIGVAVLAVCLTAGNMLTQVLGGGHFASVLGESLYIGGWVAMWKPIEIFLYDWWPILSERRLLERLSGMPVRLEIASEEVR